jgi:hypothetical protein
LPCACDRRQAPRCRRAELAPRAAGGYHRQGDGERQVDVYHVWCNLKRGVGDFDFAERVAGYLNRLKAEGVVESWRLTRRKLGLAPQGFGEFHITIEVKDLGQLDAAFNRVASRREPVESFHAGVNALVEDTVFALYRDFPDPVRHRGEEKF